MPIMISAVMTGRRMKISEKFIALPTGRSAGLQLHLRARA